MTDLVSVASKVQQENTNYRGPVSEQLIKTIGGSTNWLLDMIMPVGSYIDCDLDEATLNAQMGGLSNWVLADGRSVTGTMYATLTGRANVPDYRGCFARYKNNGRSDGKENPDGELAVGTYTGDRNRLHNHPVTPNPHSHGITTHTTISQDGGAAVGSSTAFGAGDNTTDTTLTLAPDGGNDAAPKSITTNRYVRIN